MELDEILFKKIIRLYASWRNQTSPEELSRTVFLKDIAGRLTLIARALTAGNIDIVPAEQEGGWKRDTFYLPASYALLPTLEQNLNFYIFRVVYLSIQKQQNLNWDQHNVGVTIEQSRKKAAEASELILKTMASEYPAANRYYHSIKPYFEQGEGASHWLFGKFMLNKDVIDNEKDAHSGHRSEEKNTVDTTTEIKSKPTEEVEVITVDKKSQEDYVMTHNFEKVETAEEFTGVWRNFDGDDTLEEDADALNELNLKHLVRTDEVAHSIYQADFRDLANIAESRDADDEGTYVTYKEWNFTKKHYRPDYCKVFLKGVKKIDPNYPKKCLTENSKTLNALRRKFARIHQERKEVKKLPDGARIDIDALVDWYGDLNAGRTPSDEIYISKRKKDPDLAVLFLMDLSLSTDSYADGNRVLDVEKQAVILFGEVLEEYNVDFAVGGFYSKTRNHCVYHSLKDFGEGWNLGKQRLGGVQPQGYTRIGPALRHSKASIQKHPATQKWVILLSDGKPNDYDKYEGKYGIADIKQAIREMHECHINTYAIAIESIARYYLPQMFGQNHYNILSHPDMLIPSLAVLYRRISQS